MAVWRSLWRSHIQRENRISCTNVLSCDSDEDHALFPMSHGSHEAHGQINFSMPWFFMHKVWSITEVHRRRPVWDNRPWLSPPDLAQTLLWWLVPTCVPVNCFMAPALIPGSLAFLIFVTATFMSLTVLKPKTSPLMSLKLFGLLTLLFWCQQLKMEQVLAHSHNPWDF